MSSYKLAPGYDNVAGLIDLRDLISGGPIEAYASSVGSFRASEEFVGLDGVAQDQGYDTWEWEFATLTPSEVDVIQADILDEARSGPVTAQTKTNRGVWVHRNAVLTLPSTYVRDGLKYGNPVLVFTRGEAPA